MINIKKITGNANNIRLAVAFVAGLLLGIPADRVGAGLQNVVPYLLFPFLLGIAGAFTIGAKNPRPYLMALGTGLAAWVGISIYLALEAGRTAPNACTVGTCGTTAVLMALLTFYLLAGLVLVAIGSLLTSTILRYYRQERDPRVRDF
jgi:hypothetical protein